jgi:Spy/CpxP family protein refolding chaperone
MDLVNQNKLKNLLIIILLVLNLLTVSIIWMQTAKRNEALPIEKDKRSSESVNLMKQALDLDEEQTKQLEKIRTDPLDQSKKYNDRLNELKKQLAEELFKDKPDTMLANTKAKEIGELQSKVEMIRFSHFKELIAICTSEQKEKLKPIVVELFSRKPPKDKPKERIPNKDKKNDKYPPEKDMRETERETPKDLRDDKPAPPSIEEKLGKYSERLKLSDEQEQKVRDVLLVSKEKGEQLRSRANPDPNEIEMEKEKIRKEEDESIIKILNEDQKKEFDKMILNRRK